MKPIITALQGATKAGYCSLGADHTSLRDPWLTTSCGIIRSTSIVAWLQASYDLGYEQMIPSAVWARQALARPSSTYAGRRNEHSELEM